MPRSRARLSCAPCDAGLVAVPTRESDVPLRGELGLFILSIIENPLFRTQKSPHHIRAEVFVAYFFQIYLLVGDGEAPCHLRLRQFLISLLGDLHHALSAMRLNGRRKSCLARSFRKVAPGRLVVGRSPYVGEAVMLTTNGVDDHNLTCIDKVEVQFELALSCAAKPR